MTGPAVAERPRPGGRAARVVSAVHSATLELLEEVGYDELQLTDVAARAQVNKTTVYRRWPTKVALVSDLLTAHTRDRVVPPDTGSLPSDLEALLTDVAAVLRSRAIRALLRAATQAAESDPVVRSAQTGFWGKRFEAGGTIVAKAIERGELPTDTDARELLESAAAPLYFRALFTGEAITRDFISATSRRTIAGFSSSRD